MTVRMRHTRAHTANRRSHHALKNMSLSACSECGSKKMRHQACIVCGKYKGKKAIDVLAKAAKKDKKRKEKAKAH